MRTGRKGIRFIALLILGGALASGIFAPASAAQSWQREPLRRALERLLSWNFDASVTIGSIEGPLIPEFVLKDVVIEVAGERVVTLEAFHMRVDVWALFRDEAPIFEALAVDGAHITLARDADGEWLIPGRTARSETAAAGVSGDGGSKDALEGSSDSSSDPGSAGGARWIEKIRIRQIALRDSRLTIRDPSTQLELSLEFEARDLTLPWSESDFVHTTAELEIGLTDSHSSPAGRLGELQIEEASLELKLAGGRLSIVRADASTSVGSFRLRGDLDLSRSLARPGGQLTLDVSSLRIGTRSLGDLHLRLASEGGDGLHGDHVIEIEALELSGGAVPVELLGVSRVRVDRGLVLEEATLAIAGQVIRVEGALDGMGVRGLRVQAKDLEMADLAELFGWPGELSGRIEAKIEMDGAFDAPQVTGSVTWHRPRISGAELASIEASLATEGGQLHAELKVWSGSGAAPMLSGQADWPYGAESPWRDPLATEGASARLRGERIDLALFEPFTSRLARDLSGTATLDLAFAGGAQPSVKGAIELSDGGVFVPLLGQRFEPVNGALRLSGETLVLDALQIGTAAAGAQLSGRLSFFQLEPARVDLSLRMEHFPLSRSRLLRTDVAGELSITGPLEELVVRGKLALEEPRVHLREESDQMLREIRILASAPSTSGATRFVEERRAPSLLDRASVELELAISRGRVRGRGADVVLAGDLKLSKRALEDVRYSGEVSVVRGSYIFQGRRFQIRRGVLSFDGGAALDPIVDIETVYRIRDIEILAYLAGRFDSLQVRLESDPPMRDSEVLSYLVLGRASDESPDSQAFGDAASQLAAGVALSEISPVLESYLPIDTLDLRMGGDPSNGSNASSAPELTFGKYLSGGVFVSVGRTLGRDPVDTLRVEWQLSDHWSLESEVADDQNAGLDVIWNFDF